MNGLSLEFEGSTGQNEPGIFQGGHALLTDSKCYNSTKNKKKQRGAQNEKYQARKVEELNDGSKMI